MIRQFFEQIAVYIEALSISSTYKAKHATAFFIRRLFCHPNSYPVHTFIISCIILLMPKYNRPVLNT